MRVVSLGVRIFISPKVGTLLDIRVLIVIQLNGKINTGENMSGSGKIFELLPV